MLWIAETDTRNTQSYNMLEDTERYRVELRCLDILKRAGVRVVYRPFPGQDETGVLRALRANPSSNIRIAARGPLVDHIRKADIVVTVSSSGTVWNETLALRRPLVIFSDPSTVRLVPQFANDLAAASRWCTSADEFVATIEQLASNPERFVMDHRDSAVEIFLGRYVVGDGRPVPRVISFLEQVCRAGVPLETWEGTPIA